MALIKCPECGQDVSDKAIQCIHCGYPLNIQKDSAYDIIYNGFENNSLKYKYQANLIGCIRQLLKLDLTTAKMIIDNPPYTLPFCIKRTGRMDYYNIKTVSMQCYCKRI